MFDIRQDSPGLLRSESQSITLKFARTSDTTGRVSWNIPTPAAGCTAETQAYCGMVITIDTTPVDQSKLPKNGTAYQSDPTADTQLHAGDRLGTSLVIGAYYQDRTTTYFDISGLKPNTPYYVSGFPVDCQLRYYIEGVFAYSLDYARPKDDATAATQVLMLTQNDGTRGVQPTTHTGLVPGIDYHFNLTLGLGSTTQQPRVPLPPSGCVDLPTVYPITVNGAEAQTFQQLVDTLNRKFAELSAGAVSPFPPNAGGYYWDSAKQQLFRWDGNSNIRLDVYIQATQPNTIATGTYWYNPETKTLYMWNGSAWQAQNYITYPYDPTQPSCNVTVWFDGTTAYMWNGTSWYTVPITIQPNDPAAPPQDLCGAYWYSNVVDILYGWDGNLEIWEAIAPIVSQDNPNSLSDGYFWFNTVESKLYQLNTPVTGWNVQSNVRIINTPPTTPAPGTFWYKPNTKQLFQYDVVNGWVEQTDFISYQADPTIRQSGDVWWNKIAGLIYSWDVVHSTWNPATIYQQQNDPSLPVTPTEGQLWFDPDAGIMYQWNNACWHVIGYINSPTDPRNPSNGTVWRPNDKQWYVWHNGEWVAINPTISTVDPSNLPLGTFWFNTTNNTLNQWNGANWINLLYSTTPLEPAVGTLWFDQTDNMLKRWNGQQWVAAPAKARVEINCNGDLLFTDGTPGGTSFIAANGKLMVNPQTGMPAWINDNDVGSLWTGLDVNFTFGYPQPGSDEVPGEPMYDQLGVGTDGSADERRKLATEIRYLLGYPVVDVELTEQQIDMFVTEAIQEIRQRAGIAYKHGFRFLQIQAENQRYKLSSMSAGFNRIVSITGAYRLTSAFLSSAHGAGVYGQIVLQQLYNMGTFDLLSYHLISSYVEDMEILFAGRLTYTFTEQTRELLFHHRFAFSERAVLLEVAEERTEQDLISDRWLRPWIRRYALALSRMTLAEIRGKYSTLPGASGSVSLNASDLRQAAKDDIEECLRDIEDYVADRPEEFGAGAHFILG